MNFTSQDLRFDDKFPQHNDFQIFETESDFRHSKSETTAYHTIHTELTDDYFWFYSNYGHRNPHPQQVINTTNGQSHDNPRTAEEIEPTGQFFALYSFNDNILYISNAQRKGILADFLKEKLNIDHLMIKNIFVDRESFVNQLKSLDKIRFTSRERNLFSGINSIGGALRDNYGMEEPEKFTVYADYKIPMTERLRTTIDRLNEQKNLGTIQNLVIIGRDDQGIEQVFNEETFTQKVVISVQENEDGLYDPELIKNKLLEKLDE